MLDKTTNEFIIETYQKAKAQNLDKDFLKLLEDELKRRNIEIPEEN